MRKLIILTISILLVSCSTKKKAANGKDGQDGANAKSEISKASIQKNLEYIASDELEGRATGTPGIEKAAVYIENFFKIHDVKPYFDTYRDTFNLGEIIGYNLVGYLEGNDPELKNEFIILGAHYDHIGKGKEVDGDDIANGANDDGSGTVAVMEWAKYFSGAKTNKRSILFTLYAAEEMGLKGSAHLAKRLKDGGLNLYTMINFEMIGVPRAADKSMAYMSGFERSNFAETLNKYGGEEIVGFFPKAQEYKLFFRSDNFPFYKEFKIPAHAISTFDFTNFDYYHHVDDEADKMDYDHMTSFIKKMVPALEGIMNAPSKEVVLKDE